MLQTKGIAFSVPRRFQTALSDGNYNTVAVGIRPEHLSESRSRVAGDMPGRDAGDTIEMTVDVIEPIGADTYLDLFYNDLHLKAKVSSDSDAKPDHKIRIRIDLEKIYLFDSKTGETLPFA